MTRAVISGAFTVMSDPEAVTFRRFGLAEREDLVEHEIARPAVFVVDRDGFVQYRYVSRAPADRPTAALIALAADSLANSSRLETGAA